MNHIVNRRIANCREALRLHKYRFLCNTPELLLNITLPQLRGALAELVAVTANIQSLPSSSSTRKVVLRMYRKSEKVAQQYRQLIAAKFDRLDYFVPVRLEV